MALFAKADPDVKAQHDAETKLKAKAEQRVDNAARLQGAEARLNEARANVEALALAADDKALDAALQAKRAAEDKLSALQAASAKLAAEHAAIEREIEAIVDRRMRAETSAACNVIADRIAKAQAAFTEAAQELEAAAREAALIILDGHPVASFVLSAREQLPPAIEVIVVGLRNHARAVIDRRAPASLPRPEPEPVKLALVPPSPMMTIFALKNLKYQSKAGVVVCIGANKMHSVPEALGRQALAEHLALPLSDRRRIRDLEFGAVSYLPDEAACTWLGEPGREAPARSVRPGGPITHSSLATFEVMDRGPAFTVTMPRGPEPTPMPLAVGARKAEESES